MLTFGDFNCLSRIGSHSALTLEAEKRRWKPTTVIDKVEIRDHYWETTVVLRSKSLPCSMRFFFIPFNTVFVVKEEPC